MQGNVAQDTGEGAEPERGMARNRDVMLAALLRRQPQMAADLTRGLVSELPEFPGKRIPLRSRGSFMQ